MYQAGRTPARSCIDWENNHDRTVQLADITVYGRLTLAARAVSAVD